MTLWLVRLAWVTLPITAGPAAGDAIADWPAPPRTLAEVLLWAAWAVSLVAVLAPHPVGLTTVRVVGSTFVALALVVVVTGSADGARANVALVATFVAGALAIVLPAVSFACANGIAYGDERRHPLRTPPALWLGPLPAAPLLVAAGVATGPLLLTDGRVVAGVVALVAGVPVAALAARSLHSLSMRWAVLVPAGLVVVDAMTLTDPVLFLRERIESLRPMTRRERRPAAAVDLRLGARGGSVAMSLDHPTEVVRTRRGRGRAGVEHVTALCFATIYSSELLATAAARRIRVTV
ncbi:MAG TPA: hypothetical protein VKH36_04370 [Acidimicrobiia bacterium]|nr:hypothetical protein [Acidimicrobiia bacterium]